MRWPPRLLLVLAATLAAAPAAAGAEIPVTTNADLIADDGLCSLREAIFAARFNMPITGCPAGAIDGVDTLTLSATTYILALPGAGEDGNLTGDLDTGPTHAMRIVGRGVAATVIDAKGLDRVVDVFATATLTLEDLTVRGGVSPPNDDCETGGDGGAIWSTGAAPALTITDSSFIGNRAGSGGEGSSVMGAGQGGAGGAAGAIAVTAGTVTISGTTFAGNRAGDGGNGGADPPDVGAGGPGGSGGAILLGGGTTRITSSTFHANLAGAGGLSGLEPRVRFGGGDAGALDDPAATATVEYSTFAANARGLGSGGPNGILGARVAASILADPAPACNTVIVSLLRNVALPGDPSCPGPRLDGDPRLGPLAANGGPTLTLAPGAGSVAIDALAGAPCPATDQRGLPRPRLGGCDAGAVEAQPGSPAARGPGPGGGAGAGTRALTRLRLTPAAFRVTGRKPVGTTIRYTLLAPARVIFTVRKPLAGRRKGKRCVAPTTALRSAKRCVRQRTLAGGLAQRGKAGANDLRFSGKLGGKALVRGRYTLVARIPGRGVVATRAFRVLA